MTQKTISFIIGLLMLITNQTFGQVQQTAEVTYHSFSDGVLNVTSTGYGESRKKAEINALENAFTVLFFKGIPASPYDRPLVVEKEAKNNYFDSFFGQQKYKGYITRLSLVNKPTKVKRSPLYKASFEIGINIHALKRELEAKKITQPFGLY